MRRPTSKLTRKYQTTIPEPVRTRLQLKAGDSIAFDLDRDEVRLRCACAKARGVEMALAGALESTLEEWGSQADEDAYRDL